jgi:fructose-1,6-bisphosphatase/inositol monophosphatase family enzyme
MTDYATLAARAETVLRAATTRLVAMQGSDLRATRKDLLDVVTEADLASEEILVAGLCALTPGAAILAEERGAVAGASDARWIIDPLDGTVNYASGLPGWSGTIAYQENGKTRIGLSHAPSAGLMARYIEGVAADVNGRPVRVSPIERVADAVISVVITSHFSAEEVRRASAIVEVLGREARGVRIIVSGAYEMSLVASGQLAGFVGIKADVVSHAAAMPLVRAAGGRITTAAGVEADDADFVKIATNGRIHDELLDLVNRASR